MGCCDNCCVPPKESREPIKYNPNFNGPTRNRSCTDVLFLIMFTLFLGGWGFVGYYSITRGSVEKLLAPIDSKGRRCGVDSGLEDRKYLVFFNIAKCLSPGTPITGCPTAQVCVQKCPERTFIFEKELRQNPASFEQLRQNMVCTDEVTNIQTMTLSEAIAYMQQEKCASFVLQSQPVLGRCFVNVTAAVEVLREVSDLDLGEGQVTEQFTKLLKFNQLSSQIVQDLQQSRWYLAGALIGIVLLCFIYILLLRWLVAPVVWVSIAGLFALLGFAIYLCYKNYIYYKENVGLYQETNLKGYVESIFGKYQTWLALVIILAAIFIILLPVIIFLRSRITIAIALIREGSKAVTANKTTIVFPIFPWIFQCAIIGYGVLVLMHLLSIGQSAFQVVNKRIDTNCDCGDLYKEDGVSCDPVRFAASCHDTSNALLPCANATCHYTGVDSPHYIIYLHLVNLLGFFWAMFFISGVADMTLANTFSTWYWTYNKRNLPFFTLTSSIYTTIRYHLGTVAFGALIIAIVRVIRVILEYIDHKVKKFDNAFTRAILCCCRCFFWCLENFLKFVNKNAYIMCAIHGKNFCKSASDAFSLLMRNVVRLVVLDKMADWIFFLSKLCISLGVGLGVFYLLEWGALYEAGAARLHHHHVPAALLAIATYLICTIFFNVYSTAVDTLFLCFLEDCERNDGSEEKPYFMSKNLMRILGKRNNIVK
ncbi:choline transporter-like 2 isoform X3 [Danaus plexippus]|uniref:choline transporter-like 2 isoform X3 n=1 Tax=Danaus plexippus TaxID=13037 RepID=UPI002AAFBD00|nr:choline transporter-like 2 isoform X3 [Danaus plexippus]